MTRKLLPDPEYPGLIPTLNGMGYMTESQNRFTQMFIDLAAKAAAPALEVACAYGNASLEALKTGAVVIANDLDLRHLDFLKARTPGEASKRLVLLPGRFPDDVKLLSDSIGSILIANLFHFFDGPAIERSIKCCHDWLVPGGKLFIVAQSPYVGDAETFIPTYHARKLNGDPWPGYLSDVSTYLKDREPRPFHFLDPDIIVRSMKEQGFKIELAELFSRPDLPSPFRGDGRESTGVVGAKSS